MSFIDESQANGIVKRIFRRMYASTDRGKILDLNKSHRKVCKKIKKDCKEDPNCVFIAERSPDTNKWQLVWGEWCLFNQNANVFASPDSLNIQDYDRIVLT